MVIRPSVSSMEMASAGVPRCTRCRQPKPDAQAGGDTIPAGAIRIGFCRRRHLIQHSTGDGVRPEGAHDRRDDPCPATSFVSFVSPVVSSPEVWGDEALLFWPCGSAPVPRPPVTDACTSERITAVTPGGRAAHARATSATSSRSDARSRAVRRFLRRRAVLYSVVRGKSREVRPSCFKGMRVRARRRLRARHPEA
jgi:hypothetical protein